MIPENKSSLKRIQSSFLILIGFLCFNSVFASFTIQSGITNYYVSSSGNDSNDGKTLNTPFATLTKASEMVKPGDTVFVRGGKYKMTQSIIINCKGTKEKPIIFMPYKKELPLFDFSYLADKTYGVQAVWFRPGSQHIIFDGFDIGNANISGIRILLCNNITIRNCKIHDLGFVGISVASDDCLVENNELYNICMAWENCNDKNGGWPQVVNTSSKPPIPPAIVSSHARNNVFRGNFIHECWGEGIDPMFANGVIVENNVIRNVFSVGIYMDGTRNAVVRNNYIYTTDNKRIRNKYNIILNGISMGSEYFGVWSNYPPISHVENIYIYNNVLSRVSTGISQWKDKNNTDRKNMYENVKIFNNTVDTWEGKGNGIQFATNLDFPTKGNECKNNIFRSSQNLRADKGFILENNLWVNGIPTNGNHVNSFTGDPGWIDPVQGGAVEGYQLTNNSVCIGKGQPIKGLLTDICGKKRGSLMTLGAYEADVTIKGTPGMPASSVDDIGKQPAPDFTIGINLVLNSHFDQIMDNSPKEWIVSGDKDACNLFSPGYLPINRPIPFPGFSSIDKIDTKFCIKLGKSADFKVYVFQELKNVPNGRYGLHVRVKRFGTGGSFYVETKDFGGDNLVCQLPLANTLDEWSDYSKSFMQLNISDIEVINGKCTIGLFGSGGLEDYALIDDVCFYRY